MTIRPTVVIGALVLAACGRTGLLPRTMPVTVADAPMPTLVAELEVSLEDGTSDETGPASVVESPAPVPVVEAPAPTWDIEVAPFAAHERVEYFVGRFSGAMRPAFELALERQSRYAPMIRERLRRGGLPEDMIFLPLIESWYDPHAYSVAAAVGMWQFMTTTARGVGLRVDWWLDERRDPVRATDAAVIYLNELRETFGGSIYLSAAAYNGGPGRVSRSLAAHSESLDGVAGEELFFAIADRPQALRQETRDYVPKLIAAALVGKDPARHGVVVREVAPFTWDSLLIESNVPLAAVSAAARIPLDTLLDYNPQILRGMTPPTGAPVWIRVPLGTTTAFDAAFHALPAADRVATTRYVTKEGDFITRIARANGLTAQQLNWYNPQATRLANGNLHAGQRILVPRHDVVRAARDVPNPSIERYGGARTYVVKRGDNLGAIARRNGLTVAQLKRMNRLQSDVIRIGQRLRVR